MLEEQTLFNSEAIKQKPLVTPNFVSGRGPAPAYVLASLQIAINVDIDIIINEKHF